MEREGARLAVSVSVPWERSIRAAASKPNPRPKLPKQSIAKFAPSSPRPRPLPPRILKSAAYEYLDFCKRRYVDKTYKKKAYCYKCFQAAVGNLPLSEITARIITGYLAAGRPTQITTSTARASAPFSSGPSKMGSWPFNPCIHVDSMPESPKRKVIPTQEEMVQILLAAGEYRPFFLALYSLAARLGEINNLRWEDVNFNRREVTLWTRKTRDGSYRAPG